MQLRFSLLIVTLSPVLTTFCSSRDFSPQGSDVASAQLVASAQHRTFCVEFLVPSANSADKPRIAEQVKAAVAFAKALARGTTSEQIESCTNYKGKAIVACRDYFATPNLTSSQRAEPAKAHLIMVSYLVHTADGELIADATAREQKACNKGEFHVF